VAPQQPVQQQVCALYHYSRISGGYWIVGVCVRGGGEYSADGARACRVESKRDEKRERASTELAAALA